MILEAVLLQWCKQCNGHAHEPIRNKFRLWKWGQVQSLSHKSSGEKRLWQRGGEVHHGRKLCEDNRGRSGKLRRVCKYLDSSVKGSQYNILQHFFSAERGHVQVEIRAFSRRGVHQCLFSSFIPLFLCVATVSQYTNAFAITQLCGVFCAPWNGLLMDRYKRKPQVAGNAQVSHLACCFFSGFVFSSYLKKPSLLRFVVVSVKINRPFNVLLYSTCFLCGLRVRLSLSVPVCRRE